MKRRSAPRADPLLTTLNQLIDRLAEEVARHGEKAARHTQKVARHNQKVERPFVSKPPVIPAGLPLREAVSRFRKAHVNNAIEQCGFNKRLASRHLGLAYAGVKNIVGPGRPAGSSRKWAGLSPSIEKLAPATRRFEKKYIRDAARVARGDRVLTAKQLGIGYSTLKAKIKRLQLRLPAAWVRRR